MHNTIFITGLGPEDTRLIRDDFTGYPFPGWQLEVLDPCTPPPLALLAGQAVLIVGCGGGDPRDHTEGVWFLRLIACGCPWVAVCDDPERVTREMCEAAGAAAYLSRPFSPANLRELIWHEAVPHAGKTPVLPLSCDRVLRHLAVIRADILLKITADAGGTGFLALSGGHLLNARVLDGPEGTPALRRILGWGKGKVLGLPVPTVLKTNILDEPEVVQKLLGPPARAQQLPARPIPGGREACDQVVRTLSEVEVCALVDLRSGRVVARPFTGPPERETDPAFVTAAVGLLRTPEQSAESLALDEPVEEVVVLGRGGWCAVTRMGGSLALVVSANGPAPLGLTRPLFAAVAADLERQSGMVVEETVHQHR